MNGADIMWDVPGTTDRKTLTNRPEAVQHDKSEKPCLLIDIAITNDPNANTKETGKLSKYKELQMAVSRMWKVRTAVLSVTGTNRKGSDQNCQLLSGQVTGWQHSCTGSH